jgi:hypothetical protein
MTQLFRRHFVSNFCVYLELSADVSILVVANLDVELAVLLILAPEAFLHAFSVIARLVVSLWVDTSVISMHLIVHVLRNDNAPIVLYYSHNAL